MRESTRKIKEVSSKSIEKIVKESLQRIGIEEISDKKVALLLRIIFSDIANYFFINPDNAIKMGFIKLKKNPYKDELFAVEILKSFEDGVVNADTLNKFYKGEMVVKNKLRNIVNEFVEELIDYSQSQEENISKLTNKLNKK